MSGFPEILRKEVNVTPDIKTKETKRDIRILDRNGNLAEHMKSTVIRSRDHAENLMDDGQESPTEYAGDTARDTLKDSGSRVSEGVHRQADQTVEKGRKAFQEHREKVRERKAEEKISFHTADAGAGSSGRVPPDIRGTNPDSASSRNFLTQANRERFVKTAGRERKAIGNTAASSEASGIKTASASVRASGRSIKTMEKTSFGAVKTPEMFSGGAGMKAQAAAVKISERSVIGTDKTAAAAAKKAAKVVRTFVKKAAAAAKNLVSIIAAGGTVAVIAIVVISMIGVMAASPFGIFFSGEKTGKGQTMKEVVSGINTDYQRALDAAKASAAYDKLEMSGSRAVWPEVLSVYAVKTATDPNNPQEVATITEDKKQILKNIFWEMNLISSRSENVTEIAVNETDDGHGSIVEEKVQQTKSCLYITVSHKTADEMAEQYGFNKDQKAQLTELLASDKQPMWSSILYDVNSTDNSIVTVALSQIGNVGGEPYWSWYGFGGRVEWCACFVSWCANQCGYIDAGVIPKYAGCVNGVQWFKNHGEWADNSITPEPGMIIFFDWAKDGQDGLADHTGIVEKVENGMVYTVEGNTSDSCRERSYPVGYYEILGYGCPAY